MRFSLFSLIIGAASLVVFLIVAVAIVVTPRPEGTVNALDQRLQFWVSLGVAAVGLMMIVHALRQIRLFRLTPREVQSTERKDVSMRTIHDQAEDIAKRVELTDAERERFEEMRRQHSERDIVDDDSHLDMR